MPEVLITYNKDEAAARTKPQTIETTVDEDQNLKNEDQKLKEAFKKHDVNHDGVLSKDELISAFKELGAWWAWWRTKCAIRRVDANHDGVINPKEFNELVAYAKEKGFKVK